MQVHVEHVGPRTGPAWDIALWVRAGATVTASPRQWRRIARHLTEPVYVESTKGPRCGVTYKPSRPVTG